MNPLRWIAKGWRRVRASYGGSSNLERPAQWLRDAVGTIPNASGVTVTPESALTLPVLYAVIHLIARTVAGLPKTAYRDLPGGGREKLPKHPVTGLLRRPNSLMTGMAFWECVIGHAAATGNGFAWIERNGLGRPLNLWPIDPKRIETRWMDKQLWYFYHQDLDRDGTSDIVAIHPDDMLHIHGFGSDGLSGYSLIQLMAEAIGLGLAQQGYAAGMFGNDTQLGAVLKTPNTLSDTAKKNIRESWDERRQHKFRLHILEEGLDVSRMTIPPAEAQMVDAGIFNVIQVCRVAGVPPHMVAALERATFSNIEHQAIEWVQYGVLPWVLRIEQECDRKLYVAPAGMFYTHLNVDGLLRGDFKSRTEAHAKLVQAAIITIDEAREREEMNPLPDGLGEKPIVQGAMMSLEQALEPPPEPAPQPFGPPPPDEEPDAREAFTTSAEVLRPVFLDVASRVCKREAKAIGRVFDKKGEDRTLWAKWATKWHADERRHIEDAFRAPLHVLAQSARGFGFDLALTMDGPLDEWQEAATARTSALESTDGITKAVPGMAAEMATMVFDFAVESATESADVQ